MVKSGVEKFALGPKVDILVGNGVVWRIRCGIVNGNVGVKCGEGIRGTIWAIGSGEWEAGGMRRFIWCRREEEILLCVY
jgi:hypothetical protein